MIVHEAEVTLSGDWWLIDVAGIGTTRSRQLGEVEAAVCGLIAEKTGERPEDIHAEFHLVTNAGTPRPALAGRGEGRREHSSPPEEDPGKTTYSVSVELDRPPEADVVAKAVDQLDGFHPTAGRTHRGRAEITITIPADEVDGATMAALGLVRLHDLGQPVAVHTQPTADAEPEGDGDSRP